MKVDMTGNIVAGWKIVVELTTAEMVELLKLYVELKK